MRVALVHDYLKEYGGAERVLKTLTEMYPKAPIYTAFSVKGSAAQKAFAGKDIRESFLAPLLKIGKLYSPLRFLTPLIWGSMDLSSFDLVITSCSWYITRGFRIGPKTKVVAYCHTPPRWLYGYEASVGFTKYWPVRIYAAVVGYFMRKYDYKTAQPIDRDKRQVTSNKLGGFRLAGSSFDNAQDSTPRGQNMRINAGVDYFIANSKNVQGRIKKFYGRDSIVIYPPVEVENIRKVVGDSKHHTPDTTHYSQSYFLTASRLVGAKGLEAVVDAFGDQSMAGFRLKVVGEAHGMSEVSRKLSSVRRANIEMLGRVSDEELYRLYKGATAFICLAKDEDFGVTPVEAMAGGTPVIAYNGGGYKESVVDEKTGILLNSLNKETIINTVKKFSNEKFRDKLSANCYQQARKFSKERFVGEFRKFIGVVMGKK